MTPVINFHFSSLCTMWARMGQNVACLGYFTHHCRGVGVILNSEPRAISHALCQIQNKEMDSN